MKSQICAIGADGGQLCQRSSFAVKFHMFGFGKKRRQEKLRQEAFALSEQFSLKLNDALAHWRDTSLEPRRAMFDARFAESVVTLTPNDRLSFESLAEMQALALMREWVERADIWKQEFMQTVDQDILEGIELLEMEKNLEDLLQIYFSNVTKSLENDIELAIIDSIRRQGDSVRCTTNRKLVERCIGDDPFISILTLQETLDYVRGAAATSSTFNTLLEAMRRLYSIAFSERGLSEDDRKLAILTAESIKADLEASKKDDPEGLATLQQAVSLQKEWARFHGYGSLHWMLLERQIPASEMFDFVSKEEYSDLLPMFLEILEEAGGLANIRGSLLKAMVNSRVGKGESSVIILNRLALAQDKSLRKLLNDSEMSALRGLKTDPDAANLVVASLLG